MCSTLVIASRGEPETVRLFLREQDPRGYVVGRESVLQKSTHHDVMSLHLGFLLSKLFAFQFQAAKCEKEEEDLVCGPEHKYGACVLCYVVVCTHNDAAAQRGCTLLSLSLSGTHLQHSATHSLSYLWYWFWIKLNSSLMRSQVSAMPEPNFICPPGPPCKQQRKGLVRTNSRRETRCVCVCVQKSKERLPCKLLA